MHCCIYLAIECDHRAVESHARGANDTWCVEVDGAVDRDDDVLLKYDSDVTWELWYLWSPAILLILFR